MDMDNVEFDREPPGNLSTLVIAFGGWIDAGQAATGAVRRLVRELPAARLASIVPRSSSCSPRNGPRCGSGPTRAATSGGRAASSSPWQPEDRPDGLLLFCGPEPHQRWRTYTRAFLDVAERCGVRRIVSMGALLAGAPHTRPVAVTARATDPAWRSLVEAWGIYRPPTYEGPTGISTVVLDAAAGRGMGYLGFMGQVPHYLQNTENPAAVEALLTYLARLLDLRLDMSGFAEAIKDFRTQCDRAVAKNRATREHVQQLERDYDEAAGEKREELPEKLDSDQLMRELENFLRKQREGGEEQSR